MSASGTKMACTAVFKTSIPDDIYNNLRTCYFLVLNYTP